MMKKSLSRKRIINPYTLGYSVERKPNLRKLWWYSIQNSFLSPKHTKISLFLLNLQTNIDILWIYFAAHYFYVPKSEVNKFWRLLLQVIPTILFLQFFMLKVIKKRCERYSHKQTVEVKYDKDERGIIIYKCFYFIQIYVRDVNKQWVRVYLMDGGRLK